MNAKLRGFTLIEILVVVFILGITVLLAELSFGDFGKSQSFTVEVQTFVQFLQRLRVEALLKGSPIQIRFNSSTALVNQYSPVKRWIPARETFSFSRNVLVSINGKKHILILSPTGEMLPNHFEIKKDSSLSFHIFISNGQINFARNMNVEKFF